jgi:hypothetical protein
VVVVVAGTAVSFVVICSALWTLGVFVFSPRMRDTIETTIHETVNGKMDALTLKVDRLHNDAVDRHVAVERRAALGVAKMQQLSDEIDRLRDAQS